MRGLRGLGLGGRLVLALAVGGAIFGIASAVQAAIPDSSGIIHGCYSKQNGGVRVIDPGAGQTCDAKKETPLPWNQHGVTGATGATGPSGARGPSGAAGTARAWALVGFVGTIFRGVNVTSVDYVDTGLYCVHLNGIDPSTVAAVVTAGGGSDNRDVANAMPGGCAGGVEVSIWNTATNANENQFFSIVIP